MDDFKDQVRKGFNKCKLDIEEVKDENVVLKDEVEKLKFENVELKETVKSLNESLIELRGEIKGIHVALEYIKGMKVEKKETKVAVEEPIVAPESVKEIVKPTIKEADVRKDPYEALLAFKARINKKDILKQKLISMINENGINLSELKFLFVDHYRYCSKATFYNYLKEIELEKLIEIRRENTKNFVYLNKDMISREI